MTPDQIDALPEYTPAQLRKQVNWAIAQLLANPYAAVSVRERSFTFKDLDKLRDWREALTEEIAADEVADFGGVAYAKFQDP